MRYLKLASATVVGAYAVAIALLWTFQRDLIYSPDASARVLPSSYPMLAGVREITLATADGLDLRAWYSPAPPRRPTIVLLLGKSGSLRSQRYRLKYFMDAR